MSNLNESAINIFNDDLIKYYQETEGIEFKGLMVDGILDYSRYKKANTKILWLFKEAFNGDDTIKYYSDYVASDHFDFETKALPAAPNLLKRMMYVNYGILKGNFLKWDDMDNYDENEEVYDAFKAAAIINLKKVPGGTQSNMSEINRYFIRDKEIIKKQIDFINPDLIICGGVFDIIKNEFDLENYDSKIGESGFYKDGRLFIKVYHPSYFIMREEQYVDEVLNIAYAIQKEKIGKVKYLKCDNF